MKIVFIEVRWLWLPFVFPKCSTTCFVYFNDKFRTFSKSIHVNSASLSYEFYVLEVQAFCTWKCYDISENIVYDRFLSTMSYFSLYNFPSWFAAYSGICSLREVCWCFSCVFVCDWCDCQFDGCATCMRRWIGTVFIMSFLQILIFYTIDTNNVMWPTPPWQKCIVTLTYRDLLACFQYCTQGRIVDECVHTLLWRRVNAILCYRMLVELLAVR